MRMDLMTLSLLMVAGSPAAAMAQGCTEAEALLRKEAAVLGPMLSEITQVSTSYNEKERLIQEEYDYMYYYYLDMDDSTQKYIDGLESDKLTLRGQYDALVLRAQPHDAKVTELTRAYETACAPNARTADLLNEYNIRVLTEAEKAGQ